MILFEGCTDKEYEIIGVFAEEHITRRLEALGLNDKTRVRIMNRKRNGAMIIKVRGTKLALGNHITNCIEVREVEI